MLSEVLPWKQVIHCTASMTSMLQLLTGLPVCRDVVRRGSSAHLSAWPFACGAVNCGIWMKYGMAIQDTRLMWINAIGAVLMSGYVACLYLFSARPRLLIQKLILFSVFFYATIWSFMRYYTLDTMNARYLLGLIGSFLSVCFFGSPLAYFWPNPVRGPSLNSWPFSLIVANVAVSGQWLLYGLLLSDYFVLMPNLMGCGLSVFQLLLYVYYFPSGKQSGSITTPSLLPSMPVK